MRYLSFDAQPVHHEFSICDEVVLQRRSFVERHAKPLHKSDSVWVKPSASTVMTGLSDRIACGHQLLALVALQTWEQAYFRALLESGPSVQMQGKPVMVRQRKSSGKLSICSEPPQSSFSSLCMLSTGAPGVSKLPHLRLLIDYSATSALF